MAKTLIVYLSKRLSKLHFKGRILKSSRGAGLMELMIATGLAGGVALIGSTVMTSTQSAQIRSEVSSELDRAHADSLSRARSSLFIAKEIGLHNSNGEVINKNMANCFAGKRNNALAAAAQNCEVFEPPVTVTISQACSHSRTCDVESTIEIDPSCTATGCQRLDISTLTQVNPNSTRLRSDIYAPRKSRNVMNSILLLEKPEIDYSCASVPGNLINEIDFNNLTSTCINFSGESLCANNVPMRNFVSAGPVLCQTPENRACGMGFSSLGLFNGTSGCSAPVVIAPDPCDYSPWEPASPCTAVCGDALGSGTRTETRTMISGTIGVCDTAAQLTRTVACDPPPPPCIVTPPATPEYNLYALSGCGTIQVTGHASQPTAYTYRAPRDSQLQVTFTPFPTKIFHKWVGESESTIPALTIRMDADKLIGAACTDSKFVLQANSDCGTINVGAGYDVAGSDPGNGRYAFVRGTTANLSFTPSGANVFEEWDIDGVISTNANQNITMDDAKTVTVNCRRPCLLNVGSQCGTVNVTGGTPTGNGGEYAFTCGDTANVTFVPDAMKTFDAWEGDVAGGASTSVVMDDNKSAIASCTGGCPPVAPPLCRTWYSWQRTEIWRDTPTHTYYVAHQKQGDSSSCLKVYDKATCSFTCHTTVKYANQREVRNGDPSLPRCCDNFPGCPQNQRSGGDSCVGGYFGWSPTLGGGMCGGNGGSVGNVIENLLEY
jgi:hypothetical protein